MTARFTSVFAIPDVDSWFKLWRYPAGRDLSFTASTMGEGPLLLAGIRNREETFAFPPEDARSWALIGVIAILGSRIFGDRLSVTAEDGEAIGNKVVGALLRESGVHMADPAPGGWPAGAAESGGLRSGAGSTEYDEVVSVHNHGGHVLGELVTLQAGPPVQRRRRVPD